MNILQRVVNKVKSLFLNDPNRKVIITMSHDGKKEKQYKMNAKEADDFFEHFFETKRPFGTKNL